MMKRTVLSLLSATLLLGATASHANTPAYVDSKEYKVLLDPARAASLGRTGHDAVKAGHSWDTALAPLLEAVREL